jgi:hypothetical protein
MDCGLWAMGCGLWVVGCGLWVAGCGVMMAKIIKETLFFTYQQNQFISLLILNFEFLY